MELLKWLKTHLLARPFYVYSTHTIRFTAGHNKRQPCRMYWNSYVSLEPMNLCSMNPQFAPTLNQPQEIAAAVTRLKLQYESGVWGGLVELTAL